MFEPTGSRRDAASVIFNLPGYRVVDAVDLPLGGRRVRVQPVDLADGCPSCGVISARVHAWIVQRVRDIPNAGQLEVVVRKPRLVCAEPECPRANLHPSDRAVADPGPLHHPAADGAVVGGDRFGSGGCGGGRGPWCGVVDGAGDGQRGRGVAAECG